MSISWPDGPKRVRASTYPRDPEQACFYCYVVLQGPAVMWMGSYAELWLHPECFLELTIRMMRDVHEIECSLPAYFSSPKFREIQERVQGR